MLRWWERRSTRSEEKEREGLIKGVSYKIMKKTPKKQWWWCLAWRFFSSEKNIYFLTCLNYWMEQKLATSPYSVQATLFFRGCTLARIQGELASPSKYFEISHMQSTFFSYNLRHVLWGKKAVKNHFVIEVSSFDSDYSECGTDWCKLPFNVACFQSRNTFYYV